MTTPDSETPARPSPTPTDAARALDHPASGTYKFRLPADAVAAIQQTLARAGRRDLVNALTLAWRVTAPGTCGCANAGAAHNIPAMVYVVQY